MYMYTCILIEQNHPFLQHIRKYGSAFLNSNGGTLCIGVRDDGKCAVSHGVRVGKYLAMDCPK